MSIRIHCGHCGGHHDTINLVRICSASRPAEVDSVAAMDERLAARESNWSSADRERAQTRRPTQVTVTNEGLYRLSRPVQGSFEVYPAGSIFQVLRGRESQRLYAKLVEFRPRTSTPHRPTLTYVAGMIYHLLESELVPVDEVNELTKGTGWCVFGHFLTNPESIKRGMGPICYGRYPELARDAS